MAEKILITSEKNQIGKSVVGIKIAQAYVKKGKKVVVVEYLVSDNPIAKYFDFEDVIIYDLKDVLSGVCEIDQALLNFEETVDFLPTPRLKDKFKDNGVNSFNSLISKLEASYDYVIVETKGIIGDYSVNLSIFDKAIVLNDNTYSSLSEINNDIVLLNRAGVRDIKLIINMFDITLVKKNLALSEKDIKDSFDKIDIDFLLFDEKYNKRGKEMFANNTKDQFDSVIDKITTEKDAK